METMRKSHARRFFALTLAAGLSTSAVMAQTSRKPAPDLAGVYQAVPLDATLPGGLRNSGSPADLAPLPLALEQMKSVDLKQDPEKMCQPIGPFRMMARNGTKFEIVPASARGMIVLLFEDFSHGYMRTIFVDRPHPAAGNPAWHGNSVGRWEGDTLVVETTDFNERTWLNDAGLQHSSELRLTERFRPVLQGRYLEYTVRAEDRQTLRKPGLYTRYFEKVTAEIQEDVCED
jgi:hypothetical protein